MSWLAWWVVLTAFYLLLVFKTETAELVAGAVCGAISATGAELVRRHGRLRFRPGWRWLPALRHLPGDTVRDCGLLVAVLWRVLVRREDVRGRFITVPFSGAAGSDAEDAGRRAVTKWLGSVAPNTLVVGFTKRTEGVVVHQLVPTERPPRVDPWERT
jgi:multisubunit Na+/H+ antiporter MnhE subunit